MAKPNTLYFTRKHLIQAARLGQKWDFNRQLSDQIAEVPDLKFPVEACLVHNHRHGVPSEPHIRCMISLEPFNDGAVFCDVPTNYFKKLPKMRTKRPTQFLGSR
jgi:hypothetical protein